MAPDSTALPLPRSDERERAVETALAGLDPSTLPRFSAALPTRLSEEEKAELEQRVEALGTWLQGPFLLGGDLIAGGLWRNDLRWGHLEPEVPETLAGLRVLDVGSNAGYDPFMFSLRDPDYVLACEPFRFIEQARFLESIYGTGVDLQEIGWQKLDPETHGRFELVHCHGVLYHELNPLELIAKLHDMTAPGGTLLFGSMMLADPSLADLARFVPGSYYEDPTWWWVPGPLAVRSMLEVAGFDVTATFGQAPGPKGEFATINGYFRATRSA